MSVTLPALLCVFETNASLDRLIDMIDYFPRLAHQALSILSKTLSDDKLHKPFLRLLPREHVRLATRGIDVIRQLSLLPLLERPSLAENRFGAMLGIHRARHGQCR